MSKNVYRECMTCRIKFSVDPEFINRTKAKSDIWYCNKCFKKFLSKKGVVEEKPQHIIRVLET